MGGKQINIRQVGDIIRHAREEQGMLLRELSATLNMDMGLLSKIERSYRLPTKEQIQAFCDYFGAIREELYIAWLSDKVVSTLEQEIDYQFEAMIVAEEKLKYKKKIL